jgi:HEAT repeat protein
MIKMGLLVKSTTGAGQARQLNWFGRGMSIMRRWEDAHSRLRKLEHAPFVGAGTLAVINQFASVFLTSGEAGILAGGLLLANIVFRRATYYARRIDLEGDMGKMGSLTREKRLKYCYAILRDEKAHKDSRIAAAEIMGELGTLKSFQRLVTRMEKIEDSTDEVAGGVFAAVVQAYGKLNVADKRQKGLRRAFDEKYLEAEGKGNELWKSLLIRHKDKLIELKSLAIPVLERALRHENEDENVAAEVLGQIGADAIPALAKALKDGYIAAAEALGEIGADSIPALAKALKHGYIAAAEALVKIGSAAVPVLKKALEHEDKDVRKAAGEALLEIDKFENELERDRVRAYVLVAGQQWSEAIALGSSAIPALKKALRDGAKDERKAAAEALLEIDKFENELERDRVRAYVLVAGQQWSKAIALGSSALPALKKALKDEGKNERKAAAEALGKIGDPDAISVLEEALEDKDWMLGRTAAKALGEIGDPAAIPALKAEYEEVLAKLGKKITGAKYYARRAGELSSQIGDPIIVKEMVKMEMYMAGLCDLKFGMDKLDPGREISLANTIALALGEIGDPAAIPVLEKAQEGEVGEVVGEAAEIALQKIHSRTAK